jgi:hypothetical protein
MEQPRGNPREMALISEVNIDVNVNQEQGFPTPFFARPFIW